MAAAQARPELHTVASGDARGSVEGGVVGTPDAHAVAKENILCARIVAIGHAKQVDEGAHGFGQFALFTRDDRQVHPGDDAGIVARYDREAARTRGEGAHGQGVVMADGGAGRAADHVAGEHKAGRNALAGAAFRSCRAGRRGRVGGRCGQCGGHFVLDFGEDLGRVVGMHRQGADRLHVGVVEVGLDRCGLLLTDVAANQGIDGGKQQVLRLPANGVEGQRDAHRSAVRADGAVVDGVDAGGVAGVHADAAIGAVHRTVGDVGGRLVEYQVGRNRATHGQALAGAATGTGCGLQTGFDAGRLRHGHADRACGQIGIADKGLRERTHVVAHHQAAHGHRALGGCSRHFGQSRPWPRCNSGRQLRAQAGDREGVGGDAKRHRPLTGLAARRHRDGQTAGIEAFARCRQGRQQGAAQLGWRVCDGQVFCAVGHAVEIDLQIEILGVCRSRQVNAIGRPTGELALALGGGADRKSLGQGAGLYLTEVEVVVFALHGQQVLARLVHAHSDQAGAPLLVDGGLDQADLVGGGVGAMALAHRAGVKLQGVGSQALADGLHAFGRDLADILAAQGCAECDVKRAYVLGILVEGDADRALAGRHFEQAFDGLLQHGRIAQWVVGKSQFGRALAAQHQLVFLVDIRLRVQKGDALKRVAGGAQGEHCDVVGDLGLAQGKGKGSGLSR